MTEPEFLRHTATTYRLVKLASLEFGLGTKHGLKADYCEMIARRLEGHSHRHKDQLIIAAIAE